MVACDAAVPGMPSITEAMVSLVEVTANMPSSRAKAEMGSIPKVNGSRSTRPMMPPKPGMAPSQIPMNTPRNRKPIAGHSKTSNSPVTNASSMTDPV